MRKSLFPFASPGRIPMVKSVGGAHPKVQATSEAMADYSDVPMLASRIYGAPAMTHYDSSDPRFAGKANAVENIYHPVAEAQEPRSGLAQIFNWLTKGRLA